MALGNGGDALNTHHIHQDDQRRLAGTAWKEHGLVFTRELGQPLTRGYIRTRSFKPL